MSPIVGIPFFHFIISVLVGLMPYNFITAKAGGVLGNLNDLNEVFDMRNVLQLAVLAGLALLPTLCRSKLQKYASLEPSEPPRESIASSTRGAAARRKRVD